MASTSPHQQAIACDRARNLVQHIDEDGRALAALRAKTPFGRSFVGSRTN
jgi:hypothetical protein